MTARRDADAKTILVTGANRGIGLEAARQFSQGRWNVIGTATRLDAAHELRQFAAEIVQLDVTDQSSVDKLARTIEKQPVDLLVNSAGIQQLMWTLDQIDFDAVNRLLAVNAVGPMRVTRAILPNLRSGRLKTIVNITSNLASISGNTEGGFYGYRESKAALNMFTRSLAAKLGRDGFTCVAMHPGWVQTDMGAQTLRRRRPTPYAASVASSTACRRQIMTPSGGLKPGTWSGSGRSGNCGRIPSACYRLAFPGTRLRMLID